MFGGVRGIPRLVAAMLPEPYPIPQKDPLRSAKSAPPIRIRTLGIRSRCIDDRHSLAAAVSTTKIPHRVRAFHGDFRGPDPFLAKDPPFRLDRLALGGINLGPSANAGTPAKQPAGTPALGQTSRGPGGAAAGPPVDPGKPRGRGHGHARWRRQGPGPVNGNCGRGRPRGSRTLYRDFEKRSPRGRRPEPSTRRK